MVEAFERLLPEFDAIGDAADARCEVLLSRCASRRNRLAEQRKARDIVVRQQPLRREVEIIDRNLAQAEQHLAEARAIQQQAAARHELAELHKTRKALMQRIDALARTPEPPSRAEPPPKPPAAAARRQSGAPLGVVSDPSRAPQCRRVRAAAEAAPRATARRAHCAIPVRCVAIARCSPGDPL